jgi:uncharacterized protein YqjF (DUF2071 family)
LVPRWLNIQEFGGTSWVGLVPFDMSHVTLRGVPAAPFLSRFPEMNLRLYVQYEDTPGIWFVSLDAGRRLPVYVARWAVHLPYFFSRMRARKAGGRVSYHSVRAEEPAVAFVATYGPSGPIAEASPGSIEHFLAERYCLYTALGERRYRLEIHHGSWPLQPAEAEFQVNRVAQPQGIPLPDVSPLLHFSRQQDVVGWGLEEL